MYVVLEVHYGVCMCKIMYGEVCVCVHVCVCACVCLIVCVFDSLCI